MVNVSRSGSLDPFRSSRPTSAPDMEPVAHQTTAELPTPENLAQSERPSPAENLTNFSNTQSIPKKVIALRTDRFESSDMWVVVAVSEMATTISSSSRLWCLGRLSTPYLWEIKFKAPNWRDDPTTSDQPIVQSSSSSQPWKSRLAICWYSIWFISFSRASWATTNNEVPQQLKKLRRSVRGSYRLAVLHKIASSELNLVIFIGNFWGCFAEISSSAEWTLLNYYVTQHWSRRARRQTLRCRPVSLKVVVVF